MPHKDPKAAAAMKRRHYLANRARYIARAQAQRQTEEYKRAQPERSRRSMLRIRYGITPEEYDTLLVEQNGGCGVCARIDNPGFSVFAVDHNHQTGKVRGLLCHRCNVLVAYLEHGLRAAGEAYLAR